jgi:hypothetical protein
MEASSLSRELTAGTASAAAARAAAAGDRGGQGGTAAGAAARAGAAGEEAGAGCCAAGEALPVPLKPVAVGPEPAALPALQLAEESWLLLLALALALEAAAGGTSLLPAAVLLPAALAADGGPAAGELRCTAEGLSTGSMEGGEGEEAPAAARALPALLQCCCCCCCCCSSSSSPQGSLRQQRLRSWATASAAQASSSCSSAAAVLCLAPRAARALPHLRHSLWTALAESSTSESPPLPSPAEPA